MPRAMKAGRLPLLMLGIAALAGCGSSGGSEPTAAEERIYPNVTGPTRQFLVPKGDNIVQFYGREASTAEREEATHVLHAWLRARAKEDWADDCSYLSKSYQGVIVKDAHGVSGGKVRTCPQALDYFGKEASGNLLDNLPGPIVSFRVRGGKGYAQYHGSDGKDWIVPMNKESHRWL